MAGQSAHFGVEVHADTRQAQSELRGFSSKAAGFFAGIGASITSAGIDLLARGASEAADILVGSIGKAASLSSAINAVSYTYGAAADRMIQWSKAAADTLGLSQVDALRASQSFAIYGKAIGKGGDELADFSTRLIGMAGDLAAFTDLDIEGAIHAIGRAFVGERDPLETYGIMLTDADVRAGLFAATGKDVNGVLTAQEKILGTNAAIASKMGDATGALAREQGQLATETAKTNAQWENLQAELGEFLLPAAEAAQVALREVVLPAAREVGEYLRDEFVPDVQEAAEALGSQFAPEADEARKSLENANPVLQLARDRWEKVRDKAAETVGPLIDVTFQLERLIDALRPVIGGLFTMQLILWSGVAWAAGLVADIIVGRLNDALILLAWWLGVATSAVDIIVGAFDRAWRAAEGLAGMLGKVWEWLKKIAGMSPGELLGKIGEFGGSIVGNLPGPFAAGGGASSRSAGVSYVYAPQFHVRTEVPLGVHAGDVGAAVVSALQGWEARNGPAPIGRVGAN